MDENKVTRAIKEVKGAAEDAIGWAVERRRGRQGRRHESELY